MKWWDRMPWSSFSECWALSQVFHSPLSLSSRGFLVLFTFCHKGGVICISEVIDISPNNLDSSLASSCLAFYKMYSACKLNKQGDNIQPWHALFPIRNQSVVLCPVLTVGSWPAYRFLRMHVRWSAIPIYLRIFQFVVICTVKYFSLINEAEKDVFLELPCFLHNPTYVGNWISGSSASLKPSLYNLVIIKRWLWGPLSVSTVQLSW